MPQAKSQINDTSRIISPLLKSRLPSTGMAIIVLLGLMTTGAHAKRWQIPEGPTGISSWKNVAETDPDIPTENGDTWIIDKNYNCINGRVIVPNHITEIVFKNGSVFKGGFFLNWGRDTYLLIRAETGHPNGKMVGKISDENYNAIAQIPEQNHMDRKNFIHTRIAQYDNFTYRNHWSFVYSQNAGTTVEMRNIDMQNGDTFYLTGKNKWILDSCVLQLDNAICHVNSDAIAANDGSSINNCYISVFDDSVKIKGSGIQIVDSVIRHNFNGGPITLVHPDYTNRKGSVILDDVSFVHSSDTYYNHAIISCIDNSNTGSHTGAWERYIIFAGRKGMNVWTQSGCQTGYIYGFCRPEVFKHLIDMTITIDSEGSNKDGLRYADPYYMHSWYKNGTMEDVTIEFGDQGNISKTYVIADSNNVYVNSNGDITAQPQ